MKRQEKIARLVAVDYNARELNNMSNANLSVVYEMARPRMERRAARIRAARAEQARIEYSRQQQIMKIERLKDQVAAAELDAKRQVEWMRRCVRVPFPPIEAHYPTPTLDFGLVELLAYAKYMHAEFGDRDAAVALRVLTTGRWGAR